MRFIYYYKSSDGLRHEAQVDAPSRDDAFAVLREQGVRPIKLLAADGSRENGEMRGVRSRLVVALAVACLAVGAAVAIFAVRPRPVEFYKADGRVGSDTAGTPVQAMARRQIHGDRTKIEELLSGDAKFLFRHPGEVLLARYAIPGRPPPYAKGTPLSDEALANDLSLALKEPIYTFPGEMPECAELKGIVAGMKEELRMFLAAGGTVTEYRARLDERQKMEISYRETAAQKLEEAAASGDSDTAYQAWKEQNRWLQAMGIERLPHPSL